MDLHKKLTAKVIYNWLPFKYFDPRQSLQSSIQIYIQLLVTNMHGEAKRSSKNANVALSNRDRDTIFLCVVLSTDLCSCLTSQLAYVPACFSSSNDVVALILAS